MRGINLGIFILGCLLGAILWWFVIVPLKTALGF